MRKLLRSCIQKAVGEKRAGEQLFCGTLTNSGMAAAEKYDTRTPTDAASIRCREFMFASRG